MRKLNKILFGDLTPQTELRYVNVTNNADKNAIKMAR